MNAIPPQWQEIPEAKRLASAQAQLRAALREQRRLIASRNFTAAVLEPLEHRVRALPRDVQDAQAAFDQTTGEPQPPGLTTAVLDRIRKDFSVDQQDTVIALMDRECGRNLPLHRESSAEKLEYLRLCVLQLSNGNLEELRKTIEVAKVDTRDVLAAAQR